MIKKLILIIISAFLLFIAFLIFIIFAESKEMFDLICALTLTALGLFLLSRLKKKKIKLNQEQQDDFVEYKDSAIDKRLASISPNKDFKETNNSNKSNKHYTFRVAGVTKQNDNKENIQSLLEEYVEENLDEKYQGLTNSQILDEYDEGDKIYMSEDMNGYDLILEPEPTNPYDPNAIKVFIEQIGHVGYVPRVETNKIRNIIENHKFNASWEILGGKYKYIDEDDKVRITTDSYGIEVELSYN